MKDLLSRVSAKMLDSSREIDYRVGISEIDKQHEKLFDLYNGLVEAIWRGDSMESLGAVLDDLLEYVAVHFATEEKCMEKYAYLAEQEKAHP